MKESTLATSSKRDSINEGETLDANAAMHAMERVNTGTIKQEGLDPHKDIDDLGMTAYMYQN